MCSDKVAIEVRGLNKCYQVCEQPVDRLKQFVIPRLSRLFRGAARQYYREFWGLHIDFTIKKGRPLELSAITGPEIHAAPADLRHP